jgi:hypothetical protein
MFFYNRIFFYTIWAIDPKSGLANVALEKSTAMIQTKGKSSATSSSYTISNTKSLVRIKIADAVFQSSGTTELGGPSDYISLYKLSSGKTSRSFVINTDGTTNTALIPVNFIPTDTRAYTKIIPAQALIHGEYAFFDISTKTADGNITVWTFGID